MAATGTASFICELIGLLAGSKLLNVSWAITAGVCTSTLGLASGVNTISVPSGTTLIVIVPPTANAQTMILKGNSGDTGVQISTTKATVLSWQTGSSFIITTSGVIAACEISFI